MRRIGLANSELGADLDISDLANGVYVVNFRSNGKSKGNIKLVIQH